MLSEGKRVIKLCFASKRIHKGGIFVVVFFWRGNFTAAKALIATDDSVGVVLLPLLLQRAGEDGVRK